MGFSWYSAVGLQSHIIFVLVDLFKWILYDLYQKRYSYCKSKPTLTHDYNASILDLLY